MIELIITIAIMAVLVGVLAPNYYRFVIKAKKVRDLETAEAIANAVEIAYISHTEAQELFNNWNKNSVKVQLSATVNGETETYDAYCVMTNEAPEYCFKGGESTFGNKKGETGFYKTVNDELGLSTTQVNRFIAPRYKIKKEGVHPKGGTYTKVDRWRIMKRADNGKMEIWVADGSRWGGFPCFRLWPVPDDEYR